MRGGCSSIQIKVGKAGLKRDDKRHDIWCEHDLCNQVTNDLCEVHLLRTCSRCSYVWNVPLLLRGILDFAYFRAARTATATYTGLQYMICDLMEYNVFVQGRSNGQAKLLTSLVFMFTARCADGMMDS